MNLKFWSNPTIQLDQVKFKRYAVMVCCVGSIVYLIILAILITSSSQQQYLDRANSLKAKLGLKSEKDDNIKVCIFLGLV